MSAIPTGLNKRYEIVREIGRGGMGLVYLAIQKNLNRNVAVKVIPESFFDNEVVKERFKREIFIMSQLNHPNVVNIIECDCTEEGSAYIVMEFLEGQTLEELRLTMGPIEDWRRVANWGRQMASALGHAHAKTIVHRDIKPANIMLLEGDHIKVMDFGIAKAEGTRALTMDKIIGTPSYMSPEQALGRVVDYRSDIYSLGTLLYAMLAGEPPFVEDARTHSLEVIRKQIEEAPDLLSNRVKGLPEGMVQLIHAMMSKAPPDRPVDCSEIESRLEAVESGTRRKAGSKASWGQKSKTPAAATQVATLAGGAAAAPTVESTGVSQGRTGGGTLPATPPTPARQADSLMARLRGDRLRTNDYVFLDVLIPGLSFLLRQNSQAGIGILALSALVIMTPYAITLNLLLRVVVPIWTYSILKGKGAGSTLDFLWAYRRFQFIFGLLAVCGFLFGSFVWETNRRIVEIPDDTPQPAIHDPKKATTPATGKDAPAAGRKTPDATTVASQPGKGTKQPPAATATPAPKATQAAPAMATPAPPTPAPAKPKPTERPAATKAAEAAATPAPALSLGGLDSKEIAAALSKDRAATVPLATAGGPEATQTEPAPGAARPGAAEAPTTAPTTAGPTPAPTPAFDPKSMQLPDLLGRAGAAIRRDNIPEAENIINYLNDQSSPKDDAHLALRMFMTYYYKQKQSRIYNRHVLEGWTKWEDDLEKFDKAAKAGTVSDEAHKVLIDVALLQPLFVTTGLIKNRNLAQYVTAADIPALRKGLQSGDANTSIAALTLCKQLNAPELTSDIAAMIRFKAPRQAIAQMVRDETLSWLERFGTPEATPLLKESLKSPDLTLAQRDQIRRITEKFSQ